MTQQLGWWEYDPTAPGMVNTVTGERVIYRGALGGHMRVTWSENWLRYDYVHSELTFPLIARAAIRDRGVPGPARTEYLSIDYPRSARLWRDDPFGSRVVGTAPAYGVWRRVDDCISDAFSCWPRQANGGWNGDEVELVGGWLNGSWRPDFSRVSIGGPRLESALQGQEMAPSHPTPPLMDLWAKPTPLWLLVDDVAPGVSQRIDGRDGNLGVDGQEMMLVTRDGRFAIYPPDPREEPHQNPIVFMFVDTADGRSSPFTVETEADVDEWRVEIALRPNSPAASEVSSYEKWKGCFWSVIDAFGAWQNAKSQVPIATNPQLASPPGAIRVFNCFRGGVRIPDAHCQVNFA